MAKSTKNKLENQSHVSSGVGIASFIAKAGSSVILPAPLAAIINGMIDLGAGGILSKRANSFACDVIERLEAVEKDRNRSIDEILQNEDSAALLLRSIQAAMRSSGQRKLDALRETAIKGLLSEGASKSSLSQIVIGILDRLTEHHIILLQWKSREPHPSFTEAETHDPKNEIARSVFFYGQPVYTDKSFLAHPVTLKIISNNMTLYVERDEHEAFSLAYQDLASMGLLRPELARERVQQGRRVEMKVTPQISHYVISDLGMFVCNYIDSNTTIN